MSRMCVGDRFQIQCYKHDGKVHQAWDEAIFLKETKDYIVFGNNKTKVTEKNGSMWRTKEPAVLYFFKHDWFNVIAQMKKNGIYYYCNIATPFIIEEGTIKYIDYDLDLRIFPSKEYKILDRREYLYHKEKMNYSKELDKVINMALGDLIRKFKQEHEIFSEEKNKFFCEQYFFVTSQQMKR